MLRRSVVHEGLKDAGNDGGRSRVRNRKRKKDGRSRVHGQMRHCSDDKVTNTVTR